MAYRSLIAAFARRLARFAAALACAVASAQSIEPDRSGLLILAGGGREGEVDDPRAWSARLYRHLLAGGDVSGDGRIRIAVISRTPQTDWLPCYLESLGADHVFNLLLDTPSAADDPQLESLFRDLDAAFIKGGDQGKYYDLWNDRRVESLLVELWLRGGAIGGTSAGAMSLGEFALAGSSAPTSAEVLADAHSPLLNDASDGGSAIHSDFLGLAPAALIDSHLTQRDRLGRLIASLAKAADDSRRLDLTGIGIDERTGVVLRGGEARVIGDGAVTTIRYDRFPVRRAGQPLAWQGLRVAIWKDGDCFGWVDDSETVASPSTQSARPEAAGQ